jgi:hypothetical protein
MSLRVQLFAFSTFALCATMPFSNSAACAAQNSDDGLELHAKHHASAADIGLPVYPGATLYKDSDNDCAVDLGFNLGDYHFTLKAAYYASSDAAASILSFYRKSLSRYGQVLECDHGKPVGAQTVTHSGLMCSDEHDEHTKTNVRANSSNDHELRAGSPRHYRAVGIDESHPVGIIEKVERAVEPRNDSEPDCFLG